jgi:predicted nucleotidyltransferase
MQMQVSSKQIELISEILRANLKGNYRVFLYGSRIKGNARDNSDLDLAISANNKLKIRDLAFLNEAFMESDLPFIIDIHDYNTFSPKFLDHIQEDAIELEQ